MVLEETVWNSPSVCSMRILSVAAAAAETLMLVLTMLMVQVRFVIEPWISA